MNQEILGDCLEVMPTLESGSVDCIITDLPYGTTACKWDVVIPFDKLWEQYKRVVKINGAIVLFGSQPFTSALIMSNPQMFKYEWIWEKTVASNFALAKRQPFKKHENISVFYEKQSTYNPQFEEGTPYSDKRDSGTRNASVGGTKGVGRQIIQNIGTRYPSTVQKFSNGNNHNVHPTQKSVPLIEFLIRTYTNESETVLDSCSGSFTTAIACINTNRNYICIERDPEYYRIGTQRIRKHLDKKANELQF